VTAVRVRELLRSHDVRYERHLHERAVTAQGVAAAEHASGWDVAKTVVLAVDGDLIMVVLAAPAEVDLLKARDLFDGDDVRLAREDEFAGHFPDCEVGAEPPFGKLYGMPVFIDQSLTGRERMICRGGTHTESFEIAVADYIALVDPTVVDIAA
jgi:Ala-tRNA(Pro) deacylase